MAIIPTDPIGKGSKLISLAELKNYPQFASDGVYILATDGKLYNPNSWVPDASGYVAVGVAVIDGSFRYVIAPEYSSQVWANSINEKRFNAIAYNLVSTDSNGSEGLFYSGSLNESSFLAGFSPAAEFCINYEFKNGKHGYLPSIGQLINAYSKRDDIHNALSKIGVTVKFFIGALWSSSIEGGLSTNINSSFNLYQYGGEVYSDEYRQPKGVVPFCDL